MAEKLGDAALENMRSAARHLSEMIEHTVSEVRRLQKLQEKTLGRNFENSSELFESYDTKNMKELTAILKDVVAVEKALQESMSKQEVAEMTGVVLLPEVSTETLPKNLSEDKAENS